MGANSVGANSPCGETGMSIIFLLSEHLKSLFSLNLCEENTLINLPDVSRHCGRCGREL